MNDENAFGLLISYFSLEDDEYKSDDLSDFVDRFTLFQRAVLQYAEEHRFGETVLAVELGHAVYFELAEDEVKSSLTKWLQGLRAQLSLHDFDTVGVLSHGGRWVEDGTAPEIVHAAGFTRMSVSKPSEPLRRALFAETAAHGFEEEELRWGPGLYLDSEALSALKLTPKNKPTLLAVAGATFVRAGR